MGVSPAQVPRKALFPDAIGSPSLKRARPDKAPCHRGYKKAGRASPFRGTAQGLCTHNATHFHRNRRRSK